MKIVRLGSATGWARDRFEPAATLARNGGVQYLCFDAMSEVTMSAAQVSRMEQGASVSYDPYLDARMEPILKVCAAKGIKIVTNQGWLDPVAAARQVRELAHRQGINDFVVGAVCGGDLRDKVADLDLHFSETGGAVADDREKIVSAEAYLGAGGIVEALRRGANVVITGRVADACLYLGPLAYEFGWSFDDYESLFRGLVVGHLLECGCQVSGGYFADPGYKEVPNLCDVGNPIAEVSDNRIIISKTPATGGVVSEGTCKEQLLYEVQDPACYYCPDVIADLTKVAFKEVAKDQVEVLVGKGGLPRPRTLKVLVGLREGFMAEEMVLFAGPGAMERAELTKCILRQRLRRADLRAEEIRMDFVGLNSVHREASAQPPGSPYEVVLRIALKAGFRGEAEKLRKEVDPLAVNGASGTGKWATSWPGPRVREIIGLRTTFIRRELIPETVTMVG